MRRPRASTVLTAAALALVGTCAFAPLSLSIGGSGFPRCEYRLTLRDAGGAPLPGVRLRVVAASGHDSYFYPVHEFTADAAPVSDAAGRMTFRHARLTGEFDVREYTSLLGIPWGPRGVPHYDCVFEKDGREWGRVRYDALGRPGAPEVEHREEPDYFRWPREVWARHRGGEEELVRRLYGGDERRHERERNIARRHFEHAVEFPWRPQALGVAAREVTLSPGGPASRPQ